MCLWLNVDITLRPVAFPQHHWTRGMQFPSKSIVVSICNNQQDIPVWPETPTVPTSEASLHPLLPQTRVFCLLCKVGLPLFALTLLCVDVITVKRKMLRMPVICQSSTSKFSLPPPILTSLPSDLGSPIHKPILHRLISNSTPKFHNSAGLSKPSSLSLSFGSLYLT